MATPPDEDAASVADLRERIDDLEAELDRRTVSRDTLEADLRRYVRVRLRRGHARGWGPYLVLLYGTAMTIGAFYFLDGLWAILAMLVVWLSTLGLYTLFVLVGVGLSLFGFVGRLRDRLTAGKRRAD
jgi:VIT1/CCC1 family predicted Fe2+/Mn2+ transporter